MRRQRRTDLQQVAKTSGDPWDVGAIGNAEWTGVRLSDVLDAVGAPDASELFVAFTGADEVDVEGEEALFGVSIAMDKARQPDVLIAWAMNGEPLTPEHGARSAWWCRAMPGCGSAKWLTRIEVRDTPSDAPIQAHDYQLFPADVTSDTVDWSQGPDHQCHAAQRRDLRAGSGETLPAGEVRIEGYAIAYDRRVSRVEVSVNGGRDWQQATFADDPETRGAGGAGSLTPHPRQGTPAPWSPVPSTRTGRDSPSGRIRCEHSPAICAPPGITFTCWSNDRSISGTGRRFWIDAIGRLVVATAAGWCSAGNARVRTADLGLRTLGLVGLASCNRRSGDRA